MFLTNLLSRIFPSVHAEEEIECSDKKKSDDPMEALREKCKQLPEAKNLFQLLRKCTNRVKSKKQTTETCVEELFDFLYFVDHCVAKDLFKLLK
ncbi:hypothetical protein RN001_012037 [Aquatica leii]|uniref:Cytochrome b-c1 complex subunit 6 n=1 Tax=Aquatica leii TaxID=1421715 RepID=A0AAN7Q195_9COLE|nr:hypothetical protein RN001_012037 [Aquatica leii]